LLMIQKKLFKLLIWNYALYNIFLKTLKVNFNNLIYLIPFVCQKTLIIPCFTLYNIKLDLTLIL